MDATPLETLLSRVALNDRAAFETLYARTSSKLFGVCIRILQDRGEAEEVLQETYLKIWHNADRYVRAKASPIAWLAAIARNQSIDRLRRKRLNYTDIDAAGGIADPAPDAEAIALAVLF